MPGINRQERTEDEERAGASYDLECGKRREEEALQSFAVMKKRVLFLRVRGVAAGGPRATAMTDTRALLMDLVKYFYCEDLEDFPQR